MLEFALLAFTSLFTMINPVGVLPVYTSLTAGMSDREAHRVAARASVTALLILFLFAFTGDFLFHFFQISVNSLKIVGGVIFFMVGYDMLQARLIRTRDDRETELEYAHDIAITPLAIPIICGPGALTMVIIFMRDYPDHVHRAVFLAIVFSVVLITFLFLIGAKKIVGVLGDNGNKVLMRIMGLIVMVISVEFFFSGLKPFVVDILSSVK
jgi:multiple antibiotic resistance protein